jgi:hypothetical protein
MTLIHTVEPCAGNPFNYSFALQEHYELAEQTPGDWMPWNYTSALARARSGPGPPL